ncbi:hypothetical protein CDEST_15257 [Colletotrichum destructivum]|uniref:Uncharacterized protein n=1 Tax=Colletotrichum destructivum TaxID=34406 RepID=A0AAX4J4E6_9PEZI|nr:hypothetical protein CDEST_15257 [Colletotrichum destructivum]
MATVAPVCIIYFTLYGLTSTASNFTISDHAKTFDTTWPASAGQLTLHAVAPPTPTPVTTTAIPLCSLFYKLENTATSSNTTRTIYVPPAGGTAEPVSLTWSSIGGSVALDIVLPSTPTSSSSWSIATSNTSISSTLVLGSDSASTTSSGIPTAGSNCPYPGDPGLATGPAVGLAFGCLFAGALLALALGLFCFRRYARGQPGSRSQGGGGAIPLAPSSTNSLTRVFEKLPAPITHTEFKQEALQWNISIKNYLENHADLVSDLRGAGGQILPATEQLNILAGHNAPWHRLLRDKTSRYSGLRMFIARIIANGVNPETAAETSLLPKNVLRSYQDIVASGKQNHNVPLMHNIWRAMTMNLISTTYQTSNIASLAAGPLFPSIQETAKTIHDALNPLLLRHSEPEVASEVNSLADVVAKGTLLGLHMFEQSNPTSFFWHPSGEQRDRSSENTLIVFPGIRQRRVQPGSREPKHESVIVQPVRA